MEELDPALLQRALDLHARCSVVDGHADTLDRSLDGHLAFGVPQDGLQFDVPRFRSIGGALQFLSLWVPGDVTGLRALHRAMRLVGVLHEGLRRHGTFELLERIEQRTPGVPGVMLSLEGADPLADDPRLLEAFHALGVRMVSLTWNGRNGFADGLLVAERPSGLTRLGKDLLRRMADLDMVLDLAHIAEPGFWDALETYPGRVVVSHANARAVYDHPRNMNDDQIRAIAERGGVIGTVLYPRFLGGNGGLTMVAEHVRHLRAVGGDGVLGLGADLDGISALPEGFAGIHDLPRVTATLLDAGLEDGVVAGWLGGNWLRVLSSTGASC
ncbi:MAG: membrane dipeptidase [Candidatus Sericytochromatia bacterium]|nr:membrane dipeptidase [Candidatus Sericytochromatia bacterium]